MGNTPTRDIKQEYVNWELLLRTYQGRDEYPEVMAEYRAFVKSLTKEEDNVKQTIDPKKLVILLAVTVVPSGLFILPLYLIYVQYQVDPLKAYPMIQSQCTFLFTIFGWLLLGFAARTGRTLPIDIYVSSEHIVEENPAPTQV